MANILIIFDSDTGKTEELAQKAQSILTSQGNEVRARRVSPVVPVSDINRRTKESNIPIITKEDAFWSEGYIVSCPIHTGTITAALKYFLDEYHGLASQGVFLNKPVTVMTVGKLSHAGAETTIQQLVITLMQWGSLIVSTGITFPEIISENGNPYGLSFILDSNNSFGDETIWNEILNIHLGRFSKIVDANKILINKGTINEGKHLPYTINDIFG